MKNINKCFEKSLLNLKQKAARTVERCQSSTQEPREQSSGTPEKLLFLLQKLQSLCRPFQVSQYDMSQLCASRIQIYQTRNIAFAAFLQSVKIPCSH